MWFATEGVFKMQNVFYNKKKWYLKNVRLMVTNANSFPKIILISIFKFMNITLVVYLVLIISLVCGDELLKK